MVQTHHRFQTQWGHFEAHPHREHSMSIASGIGKAMGDAAHDAILGHAIGEADATAHLAIHRANQWRQRSEELQADLNVALAQLHETRADRDAMEVRLATTEAELVRVKRSGEVVIQNYSEGLNDHLEYGRAIQKRLRQVEKALQHSSADKTALKALLDPYKELVARFKLDGELPADMRQRADTLWNAFMSGGQLTEDAKIQEIVDQAPLPAPGLNILF